MVRLGLFFLGGGGGGIGTWYGCFFKDISLFVLMEQYTNTWAIGFHYAGIFFAMMRGYFRCC